MEEEDFQPSPFFISLGPSPFCALLVYMCGWTPSPFFAVVALAQSSSVQRGLQKKKDEKHIYYDRHAEKQRESLFLLATGTVPQQHIVSSYSRGERQQKKASIRWSGTVFAMGRREGGGPLFISRVIVSSLGAHSLYSFSRPKVDSAENPGG